MRTSTICDAEGLGFLVDLAGDGLHQRLALVAHHGGKARAAEHAPKRGFEHRADSRAGDALVAQALEEQQRVDDLVAREGIDHEPLLVGGDHLLAGGVDIENALVEELDVLDERDLELQTRLGDDALRIAEFEHERLLRLADGEQRQIGDEGGEPENDQAEGKGRAVHCWPSGGVVGFLVNSDSGRKGRTPGPALSTITFSVSPSTFSMVSMKMRWRVTSGAFLYCS